MRGSPAELARLIAACERSACDALERLCAESRSALLGAPAVRDAAVAGLWSNPLELTRTADALRMAATALERMLETQRLGAMSGARVAALRKPSSWPELLWELEPVENLDAYREPGSQAAVVCGARFDVFYPDQRVYVLRGLYAGIGFENSPPTELLRVAGGVTLRLLVIAAEYGWASSLRRVHCLAQHNDQPALHEDTVVDTFDEAVAYHELVLKRLSVFSEEAAR
jgi:hypothetical protein